MKTASIIFLLVIQLFSDLAAQPGTLDTSFGTGGATLVGFGRREDITEDVVIQPDGKILVAGYSDLQGQETSMIRLNSDGSLDTTFGIGGKVGYMGETHSHTQRIIVYPNGTILICADDAQRPVMMWFKPDGTVDSSFGKDGRLGELFASGHGVYHRAFILPDSSIVAAGSHGYYSSDSSGWVYDIGLTYIKKNGIIDSSKGKNGRVLIDMRGHDDFAADALMQPDGKIVMGGSFGSYRVRHFHLLRFDLDGTLDPSFGTNGITKIEVSDTMNWMMGLSSQPDGKILAAGITYDSANERPVIARFTADGVVDSSFGVNGVVIVDNNVELDWIYKAMTDSAGRIIAVGRIYDDVEVNASLYRFLHDGTPDSTFGTNGLGRFDAGPNGEWGQAIAVQPDGKYILAGQYYRNDTVTFDFMVLRILADGELSVERNSIVTNGARSISLYPNPASDMITVRASLERDSYSSLKLYGERGELVKMFFEDELRTKGIFNMSVSLGDIPSGAYFLAFDDGKAVRSVKVIKE